VTRLTARFWVDAWLARLRLAGLPGYVVAHGDDTAGAVVVKCARLDGTACAWARSFDLASGERAWVVLSDGPEPEVDALLARQRSRDPDLWILEVENRAGDALLGQEGLSN
jgi:hypothetical protein